MALTQFGRKIKNTATIALNGLIVVSMLSVASAATHMDEKREMTVDDIASIECLALNIYWETRAVSLADAMAVSDVVQNRVNHKHFPDTICDVIYQGEKKPSWKDPNKMVMVRNRCQFSWYCDGKSDVPSDITAWDRSRKFARYFYLGAYRGLTEGATHYHATYVKPYWSTKKDRIGRIGSHIFYRAKW